MTTATASAAVPILTMTGICKSFPGVRALHDVTFRLFAGEVHTIMGQNGAGKSTLIKVLTGVHPTDAGQITLNGTALTIDTPRSAEAAGIRTVYQEVNLCPNLSVAENIYIGNLPQKNGRIDWQTLNAAAARLLSGLALQIDVTRPLDSYPIAIQQMVAIARALSTEAQILILDEPTSSLDEDEVQRLFNLLRQLKARGMAILFVTHFLAQTYAISDRITVLRNGELEGEYLTGDLPQLKLIHKMVGREIDVDSLTQPQAAQMAQPGATFISTHGMGHKGTVHDLDLEIHAGEVLGLGGLLGSGRTETARLLFGVDRCDSGAVSINGHSARFNSPRDAIKHGIGYCPEDRKKEGIVAELSVRENIILALQARRGLFRFLSRKRQDAIANEYIKALGIKTPDAEQPIGLLSGGNQQKALLARWLATEPGMLILDEPTRGIDVAAKLEIMDQVLALCRKGLAILFISSEMGEVVRVSHRIAVLRDREKIGELDAGQADERAVFHMIAGGGA
ncbi:sugar ABC transporter ATP-binding protein [Amantichitinum ursilacus]|uniref:Arabinose import ATP-binding protein AraG n=1 Tax=Amantichitinum ursilacus TaxID=857265 RepID=A0A0N0XL87_9NEIS|nr:sugar ABC transporter ATP-binding protein [Amantichitinum ursilacus]KPC55316.1 Arabinose import ATP-binding protein AraG [Amantichitinum ursilacus]